MSSENERIPPVWVLVNKDGGVTLCGYSEADAAEWAALWDKIYRGDAPHRAVKLAEVVPAKPLTDEQIGKIYLDADDVEDSYAACEKFARAVVAEFCRVNGIVIKEEPK